jgi:hypothetical protein
MTTITVNQNANNLCGNIAIKPGNVGLVCLNNNTNSYQWGYDDKSTLQSTKLVNEINQYYNLPNGINDTLNNKYWVITDDNSSNACFTKSYFGEICSETGISQIESENTFFYIYPNPTSNFLKIKSNERINGTIQILFTDLLGRELIKEQMYNKIDKELDLSDFSNGVYLLHIKDQVNRSETIKIIKQ